jgi:hypothetical protein
MSWMSRRKNRTRYPTTGAQSSRIGNLRQWDGPAVLLPLSASRLAGGTKRKEHAMSETHNSVIPVIGIHIIKTSFH